MSLNPEKCKVYCRILEQELLPAMGCTEPIAIAYAAATARNVLGADPQRIEAVLSGNIIKNVKSVVVPNTGGLRGIPTAVAAGVSANSPEKKLEVLSSLTDSQREHISLLLQTCPVEVKQADSGYIFDIRLVFYRQSDCVTVRIVDFHTNIVLIEKNGEKLLENPLMKKAEEIRDERALMNVEDIITFADTVNIDEIASTVRRQIDYNMAIARQGLKGQYGANIGKVIIRSAPSDTRSLAIAMAAAASDARMNGCEMPVVIVSGSGNQGITAAVPVVVYGEALKVSYERLLRAVVLSDLITIHQKTGIGRLSAYCGAVSAGCGAGAGIAYLYGGEYEEVAHTVVNAVAVLSGMICDGAKSSCAAKIAMSVNAGILGFEMYRSGQQFYDGDGIVTKGIENTIRNVGNLARIGMRETDREIMQIMLHPGKTKGENADGV